MNDATEQLDLAGEAGQQMLSLQEMARFLGVSDDTALA